MWSWHTFWMILHIMGAVIAFGPMYSQPLIGLLGRRNPQHAVMAAEISEAIASRVTFPAGITLPLTGWGLIASEHIGFFDNTWLWVSVLLYAVVLLFGFAVQGPSAPSDASTHSIRTRRRGGGAPGATTGDARARPATDSWIGLPHPDRDRHLRPHDLAAGRRGPRVKSAA